MHVRVDPVLPLPAATRAAELEGLAGQAPRSVRRGSSIRAPAEDCAIVADRGVARARDYGASRPIRATGCRSGSSSWRRWTSCVSCPRAWQRVVLVRSQVHKQQRRRRHPRRQSPAREPSVGQRGVAGQRAGEQRHSTSGRWRRLAPRGCASSRTSRRSGYERDRPSRSRATSSNGAALLAWRRAAWRSTTTAASRLARGGRRARSTTARARGAAIPRACTARRRSGP